MGTSVVSEQVSWSGWQYQYIVSRHVLAVVYFTNVSILSSALALVGDTVTQSVMWMVCVKSKAMQVCMAAEWKTRWDYTITYLLKGTKSAKVQAPHHSPDSGHHYSNKTR